MNAKATQRAEVILKVRSGQLTATDAATALGISRQQYYHWEQRALSAMLAGPADGPAQDADGPGEGKTPAPGATTGATSPSPAAAGTAPPTAAPMGGAGRPAAR